MRVSRVQAEQNRQNAVTAASRLFRQHGFDGIGLNGLMAGAGLTKGAFYKQFSSKEDLAVLASTAAVTGASERWKAAAAGRPEDPLGAVLGFYLSADHRDEGMDGCPIVALGADAARQSSQVRETFEIGIKDHLAMLAKWAGDAGEAEPSADAIVTLSTMVGAVLLSRVVNDDQLSKQFLDAAARSLAASSPDAPNV